jgi:hypothetical protein
MEKVETVPEAGCWLWAGSYFDNGYGQAHYSDRPLGAHRLSWIFHNGEIPEGMQVLHHCDVRSCVNPAHLFLGTHGDNMRDMVKKGRQYVGHNAATAKLTAENVREIRNSPGRAQSFWAKRFGVDQSTISDVVTGKSWSHQLVE